ncbi:MAG: hypothetical protein K8T26_19335 [Lentisphaerae bacterium]|nr:hypothetical protein [Lentisphaerota bacterium]
MYPHYPGQRYAATVPDTLDLAGRAALAIHGFGGTLDPALDYLPFGQVSYARRQPFMDHWASADIGCGAKLCESFPMMRAMSGSTQYLDEEAGMQAAFLARVQDGLFWDFRDPRRPWRNVYGDSDKRYGPGDDEDFCIPSHAARMLRAVMVRWQISRDPALETVAGELIRGMRRIAIVRGDYAYYPEKGGWGEPTTYPRSGWRDTAEAKNETEGVEGSMTGYHAHPLYAASVWYRLTGDPVARDLATRMARYCLQPKFWGGRPDPDRKRADAQGLGAHIAASLPDPPYTAGAELGHWYSHFHARATVLRGLLEYGRATGDERALEFVLRSYTYTLTQGIPRIGWINCYPAALNQCEGCALGDFTALGIRLSDAGLGDFWDDVDSMVRNQLVEQQVTRADLLERAAAASSGAEVEAPAHPGIRRTDQVIARSLGIYFGMSFPNRVARPWSMVCCTGNGTQGLYYAWEGAVREQGDTADINLLVNRAARLCDVDSFLPYAGKVVIRNKGARRISVRRPGGVSRRDVRVEINGTPVEADWIGNRLICCRLAPGDAITLAFPVAERTDRYTVNAHSDQEQVYACTFRGTTLVDLSPKDTDPRNYPLYERAHLRQDEAPLKTVERFVPDAVALDW